MARMARMTRMTRIGCGAAMLWGIFSIVYQRVPVCTERVHRNDQSLERASDVPRGGTARFKLCRRGVYTVLASFFPAGKLRSVFADSGFRAATCSIGKERNVSIHK